MVLVQPSVDLFSETKRKGGKRKLAIAFCEMRLKEPESSQGKKRIIAGWGIDISLHRAEYESVCLSVCFISITYRV